MFTTPSECHPGSTDSLHGTHRIPLDARYLHQSTNRVAGQAKIVFHGDLRRVLDLLGRAAQCIRQRASCHGARRAHLSLTPHLGTRDRRIDLVENANRTRCQKKAAYVVVARPFAVMEVILEHGGNDACGTISGCRDNATTDRILLVHCQCVECHPIHGVE